jgi:hypothetical protein
MEPTKLHCCERARSASWKISPSDLALDIAWVDGAPDILDRRIAQDLDLPGFLIDLDVADVGRKVGPAPCALLPAGKARSFR